MVGQHGVGVDGARGRPGLHEGAGEAERVRPGGACEEGPTRTGAKHLHVYRWLRHVMLRISAL